MAADFGAVVVQRQANGTFTVLEAPQRAGFSQELLDNYDPAVLAYDGDTVTLPGEIKYRITDRLPGVVIGERA